MSKIEEAVACAMRIATKANGETQIYGAPNAQTRAFNWCNTLSGESTGVPCRTMSGSGCRPRCRDIILRCATEEARSTEEVVTEDSSGIMGSRSRTTRRIRY